MTSGYLKSLKHMKLLNITEQIVQKMGQPKTVETSKTIEIVETVEASGVYTLFLSYSLTLF